MTRSSPRPIRKPKATRETQSRATLVFRDFVRQLDKPPKAVRGAAR